MSLVGGKNKISFESKPPRVRLGNKKQKRTPEIITTLQKKEEENKDASDREENLDRSKLKT